MAAVPSELQPWIDVFGPDTKIRGYMIVTPKYVNPPKEGKKLGNIKMEDGSAIFFDPSKLSFQPGHTYDIDTGSFAAGGKTFTTAEAIKSQQAPAAPAAGNGAAPTGGAFWYMPFVSNTVAHAIAAGKIETPEQIKVWAAAAKQAATELAEETPF